MRTPPIALLALALALAMLTPACESDSGTPDATPDVATDPDPDPDPDPEILEDTGPPPECTADNAFFKCNDVDPCTDDACTDGTCVHTPIPACCSNDSHCDDGVPCTDDTCNVITNTCLYAAQDNTCCVTAADCDDGDACSADLCAAHRCVHPQDTCACDTFIDCDDANPCTTDTCTDGACVHVPSGDASCCSSDDDCDDGDPSTIAACQAGHCLTKPAACTNDADCASPWVCGKGACVEGSCALAPPWPGCCATVAGCDDGHPGTTDTCSNHQCAYSAGEPQPCSADAPCATPGLCATVTCPDPAGVCSAAIDASPGCCAAPSDCGPPAACTAWTCAAFVCESAPAAGDGAIWQTSFDAGSLADWTLTGDGSEALWQLGDAQATSPPSSLYYGKLPDQDYDVGTTAGSARSPLITPPPDATGLRLRFWFRADIEPLVSRDLLWVELEQSGVAASIWTKSDAGGPGTTWKSVELPLDALVTGPFHVIIRFDSVDAVQNTGEGVYVDDVAVVRTCPTP